MMGASRSELRLNKFTRRVINNVGLSGFVPEAPSPRRIPLEQTAKHCLH